MRDHEVEADPVAGWCFAWEQTMRSLPTKKRCLIMLFLAWMAIHWGIHIFINYIFTCIYYIMLNVKHCETLPLERSTADGPTRVNYWMFLRIDWSKPGWWWLKGCVMFKSMTHVCCLWMFIVPSSMWTLVDLHLLAIHAGQQEHDINMCIYTYINYIYWIS